MLNFLRMMGIREFPSGTVATWIGIGLALAIGVKFVLWRSDPVRPHIWLGLVVTGTIIGGFLGFCYHILIENCYLGQW